MVRGWLAVHNKPIQVTEMITQKYKSSKHFCSNYRNWNSGHSISTLNHDVPSSPDQRDSVALGFSCQTSTNHNWRLSSATQTNIHHQWAKTQPQLNSIWTGNHVDIFSSFLCSTIGMRKGTLKKTSPFSVLTKQSGIISYCCISYLVIVLSYVASYPSYPFMYTGKTYAVFQYLYFLEYTQP